MNGESIIVRQNEPQQLKRLAAKKQLYLNENHLNMVQIAAALATAIGGAIVQNSVKGSEPYVVIVSAGIGLCDVIIFESYKGKWQKLAAKIQEQFDCDVLELPWRKLRAGSELAPEQTEEYFSRFYNDEVQKEKLMNWYPEVVKELPLQQARILCQRENCLYDSRLRTTYVTTLKVALSILTLVILVIGLVLNHDFVQSLAGIVAPLIPAYIIGLREIKQNSEAQETAQSLFEHVEDLWENASNEKLTVPELDTHARFLQDEIFDHRRRAPVIFDFFYGLHRDKNEAVLTESTAQLVQKYKSTRLTQH